MVRRLTLLLFLLQSQLNLAQEVNEYMDLQVHPCIHVPYSFFGEGLETFDESDPPELSWKHQLTNVNYSNYLRKNKAHENIEGKSD
jgi:hypothetical protein